MKWALLFLLGLAACTPSQTADPAAMRAVLTPAQVAALRTSLVLVSLPDMGVAGTLVPETERAGAITWRARDGVTLTFMDGVLLATRGLGHDLMAADVTPVLTALRGRPGSYVRRFGFVDGLLRDRVVTLRCSVVRKPAVWRPIVGGTVLVTPFWEICDASPGQVTNIYQRDAGGRIWWSRQWVGSEVGYLETELIKP